MLGDTLRQIDQGLVTRTELARLNERMRMADELHDSVGHHLLAASVQLHKATALRTQDSHESDKSVSLAQQAISEAVADTRVIVDATRDKRPPFSVVTAIQGLVRRMSTNNTHVTIGIQGDHDALDQFTQLALYQVVQEAFSNLIRHSAATQAKISSTINDGTVTLIVTDNGRGFTRSEIGDTGGLSNITRRIEDLGGSLHIDSTRNGISITAMVPS